MMIFVEKFVLSFGRMRHQRRPRGTRSICRSPPFKMVWPLSLAQRNRPSRISTTTLLQSTLGSFQLLGNRGVSVKATPKGTGSYDHVFRKIVSWKRCYCLPQRCMVVCFVAPRMHRILLLSRKVFPLAMLWKSYGCIRFRR